jgi:hypothetical protein
MSRDGLTDVEQTVVQAAIEGRLLDLSDREDRTVRAELIRALLLGVSPLVGDIDPDPRGVRLRGATLTGQLDLTDVTSSVPLALTCCGTAAPVLLDRAHFPAVGLNGLVGPAVSAAWLRVDHYFYAENARLDAGSSGIALDLAEAHIGGHVNLSGACLRSTDHPALHMARMHVGSDVFLPGVDACGAGHQGAVRMVGARLGGSLDCTGAQFRNSGDGPALEASDVQTDSDLMLGGGFRASGRGDDSVVVLHGSRIGGHLVGSAGRAQATTGTALDLRQVHVAQRLYLPADFAEGTLHIEGLTYTGTPHGATLDQWLEMLARRVPEYASQPYLQLAAAHQSAGHERDARRIHIARQRDLMRRGTLTRSGRLWHRITGLTVGYGYRPAIALLWLFATLLIGIVLVAGIAGPAGLVAGPCSTVDHIALALDATAPLTKPVIQQRCQITTDGAGRAIVVAMWGLQALAWAFATLFVAGFTGLVRKSA